SSIKSEPPGRSSVNNHRLPVERLRGGPWIGLAVVIVIGPGRPVDHPSPEVALPIHLIRLPNVVAVLAVERRWCGSLEDENWTTGRLCQARERHEFGLLVFGCPIVLGRG